MKRNILVILALALVCVLFVACGKEETPVDVAIGELQAARENIDNQIAALEAQKPATKGGGGTTAVHLAAAGQPTPTPVEKTRDQMTDEEREAYDRARIEEFNAVPQNERYQTFNRARDCGEKISAYYDINENIVVYYAPIGDLDESAYKNASSRSLAFDLFLLFSPNGELPAEKREALASYFSANPDELVTYAVLYTGVTFENREELRDRVVKLVGRL
ncbi:hypothetical protein IJH15_00725 [Candidatus Saccharibacteria bacterium]|nr:hypothetical protein [Candidatus Saccharibacteria bacterium]MBQ6313420.1 hypothetical protein [Candidatus Saccharibacteria bacterium]